MLEFGAEPKPGVAAEGAIIDVSEQDFMAQVVEKSKEVPVIVDFWAPWCGPCKQLTPALEAAVTEAKGKVVLAKVNVDENQQIAAQLRIQSIPTVYAFVNGQPVDGFQGAVPASELKRFIDQLIAMSPAGDGGLGEAIEAAGQMLEEGAAADAAQTFAAILQEEPGNLPSIAGLARAYLALDEMAQAKGVLEMVPEDKQDAPEIAAIRAQIELLEASAELGETAEFRQKLDANPDDHQARLDLAFALAAAGDNEAAVDELLELFRRDREWNDAAAKTQLLKLIDSLGPKDPLAGTARRRLGSMILC